MDLLKMIEILAVQLGASPWLLLLVFALVSVDGIFPPLPGETVLITAAVLAAIGTGPPLLLLILVAAAGSLVGDVLAFGVGRRLPVHRLPGLSSERGQRALSRGRTSLEQRGTTMVIAGRFIPVGRVAINGSAGALGFSGGRFLGAATVAAVLWATYNALIGIGAQSLVDGSPLLAAAIGVGAGVLTGLVIEGALRLIRKARSDRQTVEHQLAG